MNPRRLHSDTIFSINGFSFRSAIGRAVFAMASAMSREPGREKRARLDTTTGMPAFLPLVVLCRFAPEKSLGFLIVRGNIRRGLAPVFEVQTVITQQRSEEEQPWIGIMPRGSNNAAR